MSMLTAACLMMVAAATVKAGVPARTALGDCPDTPNCVSSQATDSAHAIAPLRYGANAADAMQRLRAIVNAMPRTRVVSTADDYLHVEFTSAILRFVDDVEFRIDASQRLIHVRSASRVGRYDFGVNRRRVEAIRLAFGRDTPSSSQ